MAGQRAKQGQKERMKQHIKVQAEKEIGIKIFQVRQGGGTSNTGNVARRAFREADIFARLCGVPVEMVTLLRTIWTLLACPYAIDADKFEALCKRFLELYFDPANEVNWYKLPPTVHKIMIHGPDIIRKSPVPVGLLSEEASEVVFLIRYIPIPEYRYSGLQIPIPILAKICRYLPVLRTYKMGTFYQNYFLLNKIFGNIHLIYSVFAKNNKKSLALRVASIHKHACQV
jgi:hypothetical protein